MGTVAGAAVASVWSEAEDDLDRRDFGEGLCGGGFQGDLQAVYSEVRSGGAEGGVGGRARLAPTTNGH